MKSHDVDCDAETRAGSSKTKFPLFAGVEDRIVRTILQIQKGFSFDRGECIPYVIDDVRGFHIVRTGKVKHSFLLGEPRAVQVMGTGAVLGFGDHHLPGHFSEALGETTTNFYPLKRFEDLLAESAALALNLIYRLTEDQWRQSSRIAGLESCAVKQRVSHVLHTLALDIGKETPNGILIEMDMERKTLAELSCVAPETLSRTLTVLEKAKVIARQAWKIYVVDREALAELAGTA